MTLQALDFDSCSLRINTKTPPVPEKRTRLVSVLGAVAAVSGVSTGSDQLCVTCAMPLPGLQDLFLGANLLVLCRVGGGGAAGTVGLSPLPCWVGKPGTSPAASCGLCALPSCQVLPPGSGQHREA